MNFEDVVRSARDALSARRVFGEPIDRDGTLVVPVASVSGGGGGGQGNDDRGEGRGGGFALGARPVGVFTIRDGVVRWIPVVDVTRLGVTAGAVALAYLLRRPRPKA